ncbi:MAG: LuxR C-terminal-related transcriptional regulator [Oscillochloridaceae bacterium umkhey_bin13]
MSQVAQATLPATHAVSLLVPTKLMPPQPGGFWVLRERLLAVLGPAPQTRLTLIVAPAGFGKSTVVAQWLLATPHHQPAMPVRCCAWLTLDEYDQHGLRVLHHLVGAITYALPGALPQVRTMLATNEPPPIYRLVQALLADLHDLPTGLTLVLDDYHTIAAAPIHQTFVYLLRHLPPNCHLVILSRSEPPLPLPKLRAEQQVTELGAPELRFTANEAADLLTRLRGVPPDPASVDAIQSQTDGWAIALQLIALVNSSTTELTQHLGSARRQLAEYLTDEVIHQQPAALQQAMLILAIPERICAELATVLLKEAVPSYASEPDATATIVQSYLDTLLRAHLLIILDQQGQWYRFHHLLRELLLQRLRLAVGSAKVQRLQVQAAAWFATAHLSDEAIQLYLAADTPDQAAALVEQQIVLRGASGSGQGSLSYWIRLFPADLIARRPGLALIEARRAAVILDLATAEAHLQQIELIMAAPEAAQQPLPWPTFHADRQALLGSLRCFQGRPAEALEPLRAALATPLNPWLSVLALLSLAQAMAGLGQRDAAMAEVAHYLTQSNQPLNPHQAATYDLCTCVVHLHAGEPEAVIAAARRILERCAADGLGPFWEGYGHIFLASAAYERSDLALASQHYAAVAGQRHKVNLSNGLSSLVTLGVIALAQADQARAHAYVAETASFAAEMGGAFARHQVHSLRARVALAEHDLPTALRVATAINRDVHLGLRVWSLAPRLSQARVLISAATPTTLSQAEQVLAGCLAEVEPFHNQLLTVHTLTSYAWLRQTQGDQATALAMLGRAATLAAPGGLSQAFCDLDPPLTPLLRRLAQQGVAPDFIQRVLSLSGASQPPASLPLPRVQLPELLTRRECEILELLALRLSDKEIADQLMIAPNTVRKHTSAIYGKLGVNDRRAAVAAARALGFLT